MSIQWHGLLNELLNGLLTHDLASFKKKQGFGARGARPKHLFLRCEFENVAKSCLTVAGRQQFVSRLRSGVLWYGAIALITTILCILSHPWTVAVWSAEPPTSPQEATPLTQHADLQSTSQNAQQLYGEGNYDAAVDRLTAALQSTQGNPVDEAVVLSNLSLVHQQLGNWQSAGDTVDRAIALLQSDAATQAPDRISVLAQALDVRGSYGLATGDAESAVESWQQSAELFDQAEMPSRAVMSRVNQAQALQTLGLYQQAIALLEETQATFVDADDSLEKAAALRSLGEAQRVGGSLTQANAALEESLRIARALNDQEAIAQTYLSLGNASRASIDLFSQLPSQEDINQSLIEAASTYYRLAESESENPIIQMQAVLNRLSLWTEVGDWEAAMMLYPDIQPQLDVLPPGRSAVYARVNYAQSLIRLKTGSAEGAIAWTEIAQQLRTAYQAAVDLGDTRAQSFTLGHLGELYEQTAQWKESQRLTRQALSLSQSINAQDIAYRWQWQLGRVLNAEGGIENALAAYSQAFETLQLLRSDLVSANTDVKFSFRKSVEPVYREYVDLLLQPKNGEPASQQDLRRARDVMEALQVAQLENFFQAACLEPKLQIDTVIQKQNQQAAVIYPIILENRLEVILKLPQDDNLIHYAPVYRPRADLEAFLRGFRRDLQGLYTFRRVEENGKIIYDWLVGQAEENLSENNIETLIFVLDGALRNVPMAALYDGTQYLMQKYAVDLVLGLEVSGIQSLDREDMRVLAAGLVEPPAEFRDTYARLENVKVEMDVIQELDIDAVLLREENFKRQEFNEEFNKRPFEIVHLATHGQFGADRENTFILDAEGKVPLDDLSQLFGTERQVSDAPIQLLIMSACRTATGDDREVLGIAGTTVRAGARSAIASLWSLDDEASVTFTRALYQHLGKPGISRAKAVRLAQESMLNDPTFNHPRFWSAYVLVGSWL